MVPGDFHLLAAELRSPEALGDNRDARGDLLHGAHSGNLKSFAGVETQHFAAKHWWPCDKSENHSEGVVVLPPVICMPKTVWLQAASTGAASTFILDQSACSSSLSNIGRLV